MFGKIISKLFGFTLLAGLLGSLAIVGYFWYKSGQPMQIDDAQRRVPGITLQDFWKSRVEQWQNWDDELRAVGQNGACVNTGYIMFTVRSISAAPFVFDLRSHRNDAKYTKSLVEFNNGVVPPDELLYESNFLDAWWAMIEQSAWAEYSHYPGSLPVKELGQRHICATTYPK